MRFIKINFCLNLTLLSLTWMLTSTYAHAWGYSNRLTKGPATNSFSSLPSNPLPGTSDTNGPDKNSEPEEITANCSISLAWWSLDCSSALPIASTRNIKIKARSLGELVTVCAQQYYSYKNNASVGPFQIGYYSVSASNGQGINAVDGPYSCSE